MTSAWGAIRSELSGKVDRYFERALLPLLRLQWPTLVQAPSLGPWDAKGIDLYTWADSGPFDCVVQCKGFEVRELGESQIKQAEASIDRFLASNASCDTFILAINRDGRFPEFNDRVNLRLARLVTAGKARTAELWNVNTIIERSKSQLKGRLEAALLEHTQHQLRRYQQLFSFGHLYISEVPAAQSRLVFRRWQPCEIRDQGEVELRDVSAELLAPSRYRWTLLTGLFGAGKTTAALHSILNSGRTVLFVPCSALPSDHLISGTRTLLEESLKTYGVLDDMDDQDRPLMYELSAAILNVSLRTPGTQYAFVVDGLDENRRYTNLKGLQTLSNQVAEFQCPVVFTTRLSHLRESFGNFSQAFDELAAKFGPSRDGRLLELQNWELPQICQFVEGVLPALSGEEHDRVKDFLDLLQSTSYEPFYGDLPRHPLFLQFIIEDTIEHGTRNADRSLLLRTWVERKIRRDRTAVERLSRECQLDLEAFVGRMLLLMEQAADLLIINTAEGVELGEFVSDEQLHQLTQSVFGEQSLSVLDVLLNSVLMAHSPRKGVRLRIVFAFRILQEYFTAASLVRQNLPADRFPDAVRGLHTELLQH